MVSIKDVAKHAGVAISTVSKVLNNYPNVSAETRKKVNQSIEELGFVPNAAASMLSSKQAGRIAILINLDTQAQVVDEINMQYLFGAITQAKELGLDIITVFFSMIKDLTEEGITRYFESQNIAGIIICGMNKEDVILHKLIESREFKVVIIDAPMTNETTSSIWIDNEQAQYDVAKKTIVDNNCKRVLYIAGKRKGYITQERLNGMKRLAEEMNLKLLIKNGEFSELRAREITFRYAKNKDVVVCASDLMAIGAMNALTEMDIFRPVCGFDGITLMGYVGKQMNTVCQNFARVSSEAVKELNHLMNGGDGRNIVLDYTLARMEYKDIIC
ncbi:MAG: LacI family DNA-binding transcriptional regulator [Lachnospiraceae bacterium]|nr:LacI family DNA-binding transcriptional regulator [Lachnospiraceae bacterium]